MHGLGSVVDGGKDRAVKLQGEFMPPLADSERLDAYEKELERMRQQAARNAYLPLYLVLRDKKPKAPKEQPRA